MDSLDPRHSLPAVGIFSELGADERAALMAELQTCALRRGEVLVRQGDEADALYFVMSGRFAVALAGRRTPIAEIGAGQPIGEIAFLTGGVRTATVTAMRDSLVLRLGREDFERVAAKCPQIWPTITRALSQRLASATTSDTVAAEPRPRTIAIIRAGSSQMPAPFIETLVGVFSAAARTLVLDAERAVNLLPKGVDLDSSEATQILNQLEGAHDYLIFLTDPGDTVWSQKAVRHADLVLSVAVDGSDTTPNTLEQLAASFLPSEARRLVLVHARRQPISGTARWLRQRNIAMHHHVALDDRGTVERLYRFINGTALGFVACGGGALCAAHVGLYKALTESGFEFDMLGGTSAGAAMTGAFAMGKHPDDIDRGTHDIFVTNRAMQRYTWPRYSVLDHRHYDAQLSRYFAGTNIEDLWIPYFAVSTNLSSYELHLHDRGDLFEAIRASGSIPVLLPPVYTAEGEMLVDGCLLDNVPVRTIHRLKGGPNLVVSFHIPELERFEVNYSTLPSRAELIRMSINPLTRGKLPEAPGLTMVLMRSLMANRNDFQHHLKSDDVLLVPPIPADMSILDWTRHAELVRNAYWWGLEEVQRMKRSRHPLVVALLGAGDSPAKSRPPAR
ncbi:MAG: patatin-like phospholipase family protein [Hyphomicrobium sp.]|jgi:NTE family protein